jgi:hypothetical protein
MRSLTFLLHFEAVQLARFPIEPEQIKSDDYQPAEEQRFFSGINLQKREESRRFATGL